MERSENSTLNDIKEAAFSEFEEKGFLAASLRNIVKKAGVTTGAFYGYFDSKEALFESLVKECHDGFMEIYNEAQAEYAALPAEEKPLKMMQIAGNGTQRLLDYAFDHLRELRLLILSSEGTAYAGMADRLTEIEIEATGDFMKTLEELGSPPPFIDKRLQHILVTGMFNAYFELIVHDIPREQAHGYLEMLRQFYSAGWMKIMGQ